MTESRPHHEPLRVTLTRTASIALVAGAALAVWWGGFSYWPVASAVMFWFSFGGHWVELWFLRWLRPRLPDARAVHISARIAVWFIGGVVLGIGMRFTALTLAGLRPPPWATWWVPGVAFIGLELVVHFVLLVRGGKSFVNGRG